MKEENSSLEADNITNKNIPYKKSYKMINSTKILESIKEEFTKENYSLKKENASYRPFMLGLYTKDQINNGLF